MLLVFESLEDALTLFPGPNKGSEPANGEPSYACRVRIHGRITSG